MELEKVHGQRTSIISYNSEESLKYTVLTAFAATCENYQKPLLEMATGKGFADIVFEPNRNCNLPAMIVELKWGHSAEEAIEQIKKKDYLDCLQNYHGEILLVGVNYDKEKHHTCKIERVTR